MHKSKRTLEKNALNFAHNSIGF